MSPLFGVGAGAAVAAGALAEGAAAGAAGVAACAGVAAGAGAGVAAGAGAGALSCPNAGATNANAPNIAIIAKIFFIDIPLERVGAGLAGANAYDLQKIEDENLAVADLARVGGLFDRFDDAIE